MYIAVLKSQPEAASQSCWREIVFIKFIHEKCYFNNVTIQNHVERLVLSRDYKVNWQFLKFYNIQGCNKGLFSLTSYLALDCNFEQVILSILNLHVLVQQFINRYIFSSIKKTNWLVSRGMCAHLFDAFNGYSLRRGYAVKYFFQTIS